MRALVPLTVMILAACGGDGPAAPGRSSAPTPPALDTSEMEPLVRDVLDERREAVVARPNDAREWTALGLALDAHFFLEEAEQCLAVALGIDGTIFEAAYDHAVLGTLLPREVADVTGRFERAIELRSDYPPAFARLGDHLLASGDPAAAAAAFEGALAITDAYDYAEVGLGRALFDADDLDGAIARLAPVHERAPGDPAVATALAQALTLAGRGDEAAAVTARQKSAPEGKIQLGDSVRREIMTRSRSAAMNFQRGEAMTRRRDFAGAAVEFQRVLTVDVDNRRARLYLASALVELRRLSEARTQLEAALGADSNDVDAHRMLGMLDAESGAFASSVAHFETASRTVRLDDLAYRAWATSLGGLGRWDEVLFRIEEWSAESPGLAEPAYMRVMALFNGQRRGEAREALREAIAAHPNHPMRAQAERILGG